MSTPNWEHPEEVMRARILGTKIECRQCRFWYSGIKLWCHLHDDAPENLCEKDGPFCPDWRQPE